MTQTDEMIGRRDEGSDEVPIQIGTVPDADLDGSIQARWLAALQQSLPNLAKPIAVAMVEGVARGSAGKALALIENGLVQIEHADLERLTGSEVKVLTAILRQMNQTVILLEGDITRLYVAQDN